MKKALIIVDVQKAFDDKKMGRKKQFKRREKYKWNTKIMEKEWLVIHVQHTSDNPSSVFHPNNDGFNIKEMVSPVEDEIRIIKKVNSSFIGTDLEKILKMNEISTVVITGLTTPHCVSTTTRMSGNLGFDTYLISDATATFGLKDQNNKYIDSKTIHNISLATLHDEFATILSTEQLINKFERIN